MSNRRKHVIRTFILAITVLSALVLSFGSCSDSSSTPRVITILHTNDFHGHYLPETANRLDGAPEIGGFEALSHYVSAEKKDAARTLLLDAGDLMTGTLLCNMEYDGAEGGALIAMMNRIGYDGMVLGNHEFDNSADNLRRLIGVADFPVICANFARDGQQFCNELYHIYDLDGLKVGVIGVTYHPMVSIVAEPLLDGFDSEYPASVVKEIVARIDPETDLIVILSHCGLDHDREIAQNVTGIDLIIGGHNHLTLEPLMNENGVLIAQAGCFCRNLGRIDLKVAGDSIVTWESRLIPMLTEGIDPDHEISEMVARFRAEIDSAYGQVIGQLKNRWEPRYGEETNVGNWLTDALRRRLNTDMAIINTGGMRKILEAGPITKRDVLELIPFSNLVVTFECTGAQLRTITECNITTDAEGYRTALQISGFSYEWRETADSKEVVDIKVGGRRLDPDKLYSVASIDYVVMYNAVRYFGFEVPVYERTGVTLTDLIISEIMQAGDIESHVDGRIKQVKAKP